MLPLRSLLPCLFPLALVACNNAKDDTGTGHHPRDSDTGQAVDGDGDGFSADDCNDGDASIHPGVDDPCDGVDNDCDSETDEDAPPVYADSDHDGFGDASTPLACDAGGVANARDCDDTNPDTFPGADEVCNRLDDDCDGTPDNGLPPITSWLDADGDGSGDPSASVIDCEVPAGHVANDYDCDDRSSAAPTWVQTTGRSGARGTLTDPLSTIQAAIEQGSACVRVGPGSYTESVDFRGHDTDVSSTDGPEATWIYAYDASAVTFDSGESSAAVLDGFSISGSSGRIASSSYESYSDPYYYYYYYTYYYGGGIYIGGASPTLRNLTITSSVLPIESYSSYWDGDNYYSYSWYGYGGGIYVGSGNPTLTDVKLSGNQAAFGGAIYLESGASLTGTRLQLLGNYAEYGPAIDSSYYNTVVLDNIIVNANSSAYGIGSIYVGYQSNVTLNHATIVSNDMGIYGDYAVYITVKNSIIAGNNSGIYNASSEGGSTYTLTYNNVNTNGSYNYYGLTDPTGTDGNIQVAPHFTTWVDDSDYTNDDLTLRTSSGCVNAGDPSETDVDGSPNDMGAFGGPYGVFP